MYVHVVLVVFLSIVPSWFVVQVHTICLELSLLSITGEPYTQRCDIFSFAITLWEMLARKVPTVSASEQHNTFSILFQMAEGML